MFEKDLVKTDQGDLEITFICHASLEFGWNDRVIQADPVSAETDYGKRPKADLILVTHGHSDHFDPAAIAGLTKKGTVVVANPEAGARAAGAVVLRNGERADVQGVAIEAVSAYNLVHMRSPGHPFHPKGIGNGYVLTLGGVRVYLAGDTEDIPEMADLRGIDVAFLPMNLPYTMTPEMAADAARMFRPKILYPYHTGETDTSRLKSLLKDDPGIEVRLRRMR